MVKSIVSLLIVLFLPGCDDYTITGPPPYQSDNTLDVYSTTYQDGNGYYHYPYTGYYGSIYFETQPTTLVGWTSPDEFCVDVFGEYVCEPVISGQTYSREDGTGQQNFYMNETFIGDTLILIGYVSDVQDIIKLIIEE